MQTSTPVLLGATTAPAALLRRGAVAPRSGIVHLGLGNFHRAHQAVCTAAAMADGDLEWGIVGVASRSRAVVDALQAQDLMYTVAEIGRDRTRYSIPRVHSDVFVGAEEPHRVVHAIAEPSTRVVTVTVTEHGYTFSPSTGRLDLDDLTVRRDLRTRSEPRSTIGQIARGLQQRMAHDAGPLAVLSCDNLAQNGHRTRALVLDFLAQLDDTDTADLVRWVETHVAFPNSMVDRIVPSTSDVHRAAVLADLGIRDAAPVPAEPYFMWVMEDSFPGGRPTWEVGGAVFTSEVDRYEAMKLRLLNGTHSLLAYLGALAGHAIIPGAATDDAIREAAHAVLWDEYLPTLAMPSGVDPATYEAELLVRWQNTSLGHRTSQVGSDGSVKLPERICEPVLHHLAGRLVPHHIALTVAAYIACIAPPSGFDPGPHARAMRDPAAERLRVLAAQARSSVELAQLVFHRGDVFQPELAAQRSFVERVGELLGVLVRDGVDAAVRDAAQAATTRRRAEDVQPIRSRS